VEIFFTKTPQLTGREQLVENLLGKTLKAISETLIREISGVFFNRKIGSDFVELSSTLERFGPLD
jgi:hypothetical protein